jgi:hypothetical protein
MKQYIVDLICGSVAGLAGSLVGHPLDTIKECYI